jgi:NAD(P)-dependent dehydrogenase (short-subunit alcohol dehydrogenase family)
VNRIDLDGRVAVITGGGQGIGFAVAERFLRSGAEVCLWDREAVRVAEAARGLLDMDLAPDPKVTFETVDIGDPLAVERAAANTIASHGRIDILVNNAAIVGPNAPLWEYPVEEWHDVVHVGINGTFHCCRAVVPRMIAQDYGRVVNVASVAGKEGNPNAAAYSSAKAAVIALTKSLGKEVAKSNIAINCVTPAVARTPGAMAQAPSHIEYMLSRIPRGRFLELPEAAAMIAWLASEENSFTTAAVFDLSGGRATY